MQFLWRTDKWSFPHVSDGAVNIFQIPETDTFDWRAVDPNEDILRDAENEDTVL